MKRIMIVVILSITILFGQCVSFASEQGVLLSKEEANKLISDAHDIEYTLIYRIQWMKYGKTYSLKEIYHIQEHPDVSYGEVREDIGFDKGESSIRQTFVSEISNSILSGERYKLLSNNFRTIDGKICLGYVVATSFWDVYVNQQDLSKEIEISYLKNGKAVANVPTLIREYSMMDYPEFIPCNEVSQGITKVYFEYEEGAWKISGGDFFTFLDEYGMDNNPPTGDNMLGMGIVVCLALLFTVVLKSRKYKTR